ncbi:MAG: hypothetical protein KIT84_35505 [Labilithrix sp.]|nr:hypothetical protein [Labilithrix sp.]MCW5816359.1 hypothetical protein [Labilithrix sp.]
MFSGCGSPVSWHRAGVEWAVHEGQQPTTTAPFHAPGGDWTFFDAEASGGVRFGVGFAKIPQEKLAFVNAVLWAPDRGQGTKPLAPTTFSIAVLGAGMRPTGTGGYTGTGGSWYATKLFLQASTRSRRATGRS